MRTMTATRFAGYRSLRETDATRPEPRAGEVLVRVKAAGVTPLEHTVLFGNHPRATAPLVLGNEGAGVIEKSSIPDHPVGRRVAFTGGYGVVENGSWQEFAIVRTADLLPVPDSMADIVAASLPVAYLTALIAMTQAGFAPGKTVFAPAIGGSVGNATYQLAKALGAKRAISTAGGEAKLVRARDLGFDDVINLEGESILDGIARLTETRGADVVIDSLGGPFTGDGLRSLAMGGTLVTLGYTAGRKAGIDVTDLIWKRARMFGFALAAQVPASKLEAWKQIMALVADGSIKPIVERVYPFTQAAEALRHLHEDRPFGKVVLEL